MVFMAVQDSIKTEVNIVAPVIILLVCLIFVVLVDPYIQKRPKKMMSIIILAVFGLVAFEIFGFYTEHVAVNPLARTVCSVFGYSLRPVVILLFCIILDMERRHLWEWILILLNAGIHSTAFYSRVCFEIGADNVFFRGPLGYTSHVVSAILLIRFVQLSIRQYGHKRWSNNLIPLFSSLMVVISVLIDSFGGEWRFLQVPLLLPVTAISCVMIYIWLHLQFVREHEDDLEAAHRIRIMEAQIQPHFIYNSLTVISSYLDEPQKAEEALENFSGFLRGSIDLLNSTECIEAAKEFETVRHFLYLEKERFGENLTVKQDIEDLQFTLPAFTVQTLVENAINHGIRKNKGGKGTLSVKCYATDHAHVIEVEDDGAGFDRTIEGELGSDGTIAEPKRKKAVNFVGDVNEERPHIGLYNLRERLRFMCDGSVYIRSSPGKGTTVKVTIPLKQA